MPGYATNTFAVFLHPFSLEYFQIDFHHLNRKKFVIFSNEYSHTVHRNQGKHMRMHMEHVKRVQVKWNEILTCVLQNEKDWSHFENDENENKLMTHCVTRKVMWLNLFGFFFIFLFLSHVSPFIDAKGMTKTGCKKEK